MRSFGIDEKPKVLLIDPLDVNYGSTYRGRIFLRALSAIGCECSYVEANYKGGTLPGNVFNVPQKNNIFSYFFASLRRMWLCFILDYDFCIIQKCLPVNLFPIFASLVRGKKTIVDWDDLEAPLQVSNFRKHLILLCEKIMARLPVTITTHSDFINEYIKNLGGKNSFYLPQAVDDEFLNTPIDGAKVRRQYNLDGKLVVGYVVTFNIGSTYDLENILRTYKEIEGLCLNAVLLVVGGGPLQRQVEAKIAGFGLRNVIVTGLVAHEKVPEFIAACDTCLIYMSDNDLTNQGRVSLKLVEYCAVGKPIIGKVVGETMRLLGEYVFAWDKNNFSPQGKGVCVSARGKVMACHSVKALSARLKELLSIEAAS